MALGLALSGGGIRGASHIGVLKALEEAGLKPEMVAGSSAGSIVASLYATGVTVDSMEAAFLKYASSVLDIDFFGALGALLRLCSFFKGKPSLDGLIKGNNAERIVHDLTEGKRISQANIPLAITATDINDGTSVVFASQGIKGQGDGNTVCCSDVLISEAVRASIAIPVVFKPKTIRVGDRTRRLVDGGVTNNLPIGVLRTMGAQSIIGINLGYSGQRQDQVNNIVEVGSQTVDIMMYQITKLRNSCDNVVEIRHNRRSVIYPINMNRQAVVVNPQIYDVSLYEIKKIPQCIERGYDAIKSRLPEIKKVLQI